MSTTLVDYIFVRCGVYLAHSYKITPTPGADSKWVLAKDSPDAGCDNPDPLRPRRRRARRLLPALARAAPLHHFRLHDGRRGAAGLRCHAAGSKYFTSLMASSNVMPHTQLKWLQYNTTLLR